MNETILVGRGREILEVSRRELEARLSPVAARCEERLRFMSEEHHRVRNFVVRELPRVGVPIDPVLLARALNLPSDRILNLLEELERRLFFLVRNERGAVSWAYPVTVEQTPHYMAFSTGERLHGA
jgi:hypothetical protein